VRLRIEAANTAVEIEHGRIAPLSEQADAVLRIPDGELRPGLINAHEHLHRNHYGRLGTPPYHDAYAWGDDIHAHDAVRIAEGKAWPRQTALLEGAWKNLFSGVTTVVHHDRWEPEFDHGFPIRVARVRSAHSLRFEKDPTSWHPADGPFAVHLAEGTNADAADEVWELAERGLLTRDLLAVHAVGLDADGVARLRAIGAAVVWCPASNLFLFDRTAPVGLLAPGIDVLLGTDSCLTGSLSLLDELRLARGLGLLSDERLLAAVGTVAAARLGLPMPSLEVGAVADLAVFRAPIFEARLPDVALVMVDGALRLLDPALAAVIPSSLTPSRSMTRQGVTRLVFEEPASVQASPPIGDQRTGG
jgi:cytosine/adenosine deaminase-related metal-dependent hydrolase